MPPLQEVIASTAPASRGVTRPPSRNARPFAKTFPAAVEEQRQPVRWVRSVATAADVADLHVRDVPQPVVIALRERAARNGRSMQQELRQVLEAAATGAPPGGSPEPIRLRTVRTTGCSTWERRRSATTPAADRALLDADVLLAATDEAREDHERAVAVLDVWLASGLVRCTSGQVLRDHLVVATVLVHGVDTVVTSDVEDSAGFGHLVQVVDLRS